MHARLVCLPALVITCSSLLAAESTPESISALGRLEPEHGIIRVASPSTPQAAYGAVLAALRVEEGDDVEQGQLLAVADTAAVMEAIVNEARAQVERAQREVESARSMATTTCTRADVAEREAQRRARTSRDWRARKRPTAPAARQTRARPPATPHRPPSS